MSLKESQTAALLRRVGAKWTKIRSGSVLAGAAEQVTTRVETIGRSSYCYRWLTDEPNPDVIVINLRETRTVGPFLGLLERAIEPVARSWDDSKLVAAAAAVRAYIGGSKAGRLFSAIFEPPEPPERQQNNHERDK